MVPPLVTASRWAPGTALQRAGDPVPHDARAQLGELVARVAPGEHVERRLQRADRGSVAIRRGPPHQRLQLVDRPLVQRDHRDDLLGEHVERVARVTELLDLARPHPLGHDGRLDQVAAVLGEDHARGDGARPGARPGRSAAGRSATLGGDSTWTTRSTAPMSMPSSRLEVATTAGSRPDFSASSIWARSSLETDPWCARTISGTTPLAAPPAPSSPPGWHGRRAVGEPVRPCTGVRRSDRLRVARRRRSQASSLSRAHSRSARRRELANTIVERWASIRSSSRSSTCGQIDRRAGARPAAGRRQVAGGRGARRARSCPRPARRPRLDHLLARAAGPPSPGAGRRGTAPPRSPAARSPTGRCAGRAGPAGRRAAPG